VVSARFSHFQPAPVPSSRPPAHHAPLEPNVYLVLTRRGTVRGDMCTPFTSAEKPAPEYAPCRPRVYLALCPIDVQPFYPDCLAPTVSGSAHFRRFTLPLLLQRTLPTVPPPNVPMYICRHQFCERRAFPPRLLTHEGREPAPKVGGFLQASSRSSRRHTPRHQHEYIDAWSAYISGQLPPRLRLPPLQR
jgi:hypothetical protein